MKVTEKWRCSAMTKTLARTTTECKTSTIQSAQAERERGESGSRVAGRKHIHRDSAAARVSRAKRKRGLKVDSSDYMVSLSNPKRSTCSARLSASPTLRGAPVRRIRPPPRPCPVPLPARHVWAARPPHTRTSGL